MKQLCIKFKIFYSCAPLRTILTGAHLFIITQSLINLIYVICVCHRFSLIFSDWSIYVRNFLYTYIYISKQKASSNDEDTHCLNKFRMRTCRINRIFDLLTRTIPNHIIIYKYVLFTMYVVENIFGCHLSKRYSQLHTYIICIRTYAHK